MSAFDKLSHRERQVARLLALGLDGHAIGKRLAIDVKTVYTHRQHVLDKLGLKSRGANNLVLLARLAIRERFVSPLDVEPEPTSPAPAIDTASDQDVFL